MLLQRNVSQVSVFRIARSRLATERVQELLRGSRRGHMNKKQMVVLWVVMLLLSIAAIVEGVQTDDALIGLGGPSLLIGVTLMYQFRDKRVSPSLARTKQLLLAVVGLLLVQTLLLFAQGRELRRSRASVQHMEDYLDSISTDVSTIQSDVSTLQTDVSDIETNVANLDH
jgi:hypothetical protein